ncbi:DUF1156 domain-containing protein [Pirellula sp. SH-Sr6A]|uniref:DUF1156 domain-containing protein n=1 Tax=Pirellula sp. SH-Sr6A TaxID=1632865 RepID=UPI001F0B313D|nr:hypothetical protein [Pirellula sp. SH-Sr6A]
MEALTAFAKRVNPERITAEMRQLQETLSEESRGRWEALAAGKLSLNPDDAVDMRDLRMALLDFIADFANWDNSTVPAYLETSQTLTQAAHEALGGEPGTRPLVVDPFAGGGSIPLEALRVGADAFASDLNPVPVLLNKVVLEYIPKYGIRLAEEVRKWGAWIKEHAEKELAEFYPNDPDGGTPIAYLWARTILSEAPDANLAPVEVPLLRTMWLSKRRGFAFALRWIRDKQGKVVTDDVLVQSGDQPKRIRRPRLEIFSPVSDSEVENGTVKGGSATCPVSGFTTSAARVKEQLKTQRGGAQSARLYAMYVERSSTRGFRTATSTDLTLFHSATRASEEVLRKNPDAFPIENINPIRPYKNSRGLSAVTRIGCITFSDLYNRRQALAIHTLYEALTKIEDLDHGLETDLLKAVQVALAFAINRSVSQNTSMSRWDASRLTIKGAFSKQALAVVWDFAEANPFSGGSADWDGAIAWVTKFIYANSILSSPGTVVRSSATRSILPTDSAAALVTDPPYFAAIPYADLSDFFYVWFRRGLRDVFGELFKSSLSEKDDELIVTNAQKGPGGRQKDDMFFREGMATALRTARDCVLPSGIGVVVYAEGTTAGWEAILGAIIDAEWMVTSSWPIDTEMTNRTQAHESASLQSSIHIICRPREDASGAVTQKVGEWRDVLRELPIRIHEWMPRLAAEGVVGADAIFACLGPALEVFSRYSRVEKANGETATLREYLEHVWGTVSSEALSLIFKDANAAGLEPDARLSAMWLWTIGGGSSKEGKKPKANSEEADDSDDASDDDDDLSSGSKGKSTGGFVLEFDAARKIAQGLGVDLEQCESLVEVKGDKARLLPVAERKTYLFGQEAQAGNFGIGRRKKMQQKTLFAELDEIEAAEAGWIDLKGPTPGTTVLDRVHQAMILFAGNRGELLKRFLVEDGVGKDERFWKLADNLNKLYPPATDERRWVEGVLARKKGLGL